MGRVLELAIPSVFGFYLVSSLFREYYSLAGRVTVLENKLETVKEKISDLELFKLKVYSNDVVLGRRAWDEIDIDIDMPTLT